MSSRRRRARNTGAPADAFGTSGEEQQGDSGNLEDFANMLYKTGTIGDELRRADTGTTRIKKLPLAKVLPDPSQARRVMPPALRKKWILQPDSVVEVLNSWLSEADAEAAKRGRPQLDVETLLSSDPSNTSDMADDGDLPEIGPIENSFRAMVALATSIRHHGLANPVTVVQTGDTFQLETGERRLLAYNLLHSLPQLVSEASYEVIPARVVEEKSLWRQAAENGARQDLNAISVARQLSLLLMDVYQGTHQFTSAQVMPGREWYAQVYNSKDFPVPYGRGAEMAAAIGLKSANQLRQYRQLLDLPDGVWDLADELDWTEYRLRQMRMQARRLSEKLDGESELDVLSTIARFEAGVIHELPDAYMQDAMPGKGRQPKSPSAKKSNKMVARQLPAEVTVADTNSGTLTLNVDDPEVLALLASGERVVITIKRG